MSNQLTREQYEQLVQDYIEAEYQELLANTPVLTLTANSFAQNTATEPIDSTYFLELDDDWGLPLPFGWVALDEHFTGAPEQDYYTDFIIEVKYDD